MLMSWRGFWTWVDQDFNETRPYSLVLFMGLLSLPLALAFAFDASENIVESARGFDLIGVVVLMIYYLYRSARNIWRSFNALRQSRKDDDERP